MVNLVKLPDFFTNPWWGINGSYTFFPIEFQGKTCIRMDRNPSFVAYAKWNNWYGLNEINGGLPTSANIAHTVPVKPGDRVTFRAKIWTEPNKISGGGGCYMLIDVYGSNGRITELRGASAVPDNSVDRVLVSFGSGGWIQKDITFIVESIYKNENGSGSTVPNGLVMIFETLHFSSWDETARTYITDIEVYVNESPSEPPVVIPPTSPGPTIPPITQPVVYVCPYGDGYLFATKQELYNHVIAEHHTDAVPGKTLAARVPMVGNHKIVQVYLRKIRDKLISRETHKRLHPLV
jgi:hypothetical protein